MNNSPSPSMSTKNQIEFNHQWRREQFLKDKRNLWCMNEMLRQEGRIISCLTLLEIDYKMIASNLKQHCIYLLGAWQIKRKKQVNMTIWNNMHRKRIQVPVYLKSMIGKLQWRLKGLGRLAKAGVSKYLFRLHFLLSATNIVRFINYHERPFSVHHALPQTT